jgi:flavin-dependent dehydrogenase
MTHEVIVLGAGPAGSAVARRLAASGICVALIGMTQRAGWEGVSDRSRLLLAEEGVEHGRDLLTGPLVRRGRWADRLVEGREWLVERARLASLLRDRAVSAGAEVRVAAVTGVARTSDEWRVVTRGGDLLTAPVLIEARGRRGRARRGPLLLAIGQAFRRHPRGVVGTRIEPADFGWCWWVERDDELWVQIVARPGRSRPDGWVAAAARQIPGLSQALNGATPTGEPSACAAHARFGLDRRSGAQEPALRPWRVGDAAVALDPLSGQGIYQALKSAKLVATAILSVLNGGDAALAERFVIERHEEDFLRGVRVATEFYGQNAAHGEFWAQTTKAYEVLSVRHGRPRVAGQRIERRPTLIDGRIVEREVIVSRAHPRGVLQVAGVPLAELVRHLELNAGATPASVSRCLGRPDRAVAAAMHWLDQAGPTQGKDALANHPGG